VHILDTQCEGVKTVYVIGETLEGWPRYELWVYSPTQIHHPYQFEVYVQDQDMSWRRIVLHTIPEKLLPFIMKAFSEVRRPDQMGAFSDPQAVQGVEEEPLVRESLGSHVEWEEGVNYLVDARGREYQEFYGIVRAMWVNDAGFFHAWVRVLDRGMFRVAVLTRQGPFVGDRVRIRVFRETEARLMSHGRGRQ
jgi:hypothetical protein